ECPAPRGPSTIIRDGNLERHDRARRPAGARYLPVEALVDTGASYTMVPGGLLRELGVGPHDRVEFVAAGGRRVERKVGRTWLRVNGRSEITLVIFGEETSTPCSAPTPWKGFGSAPTP
ncbi:MAG: aspartyl protease family protein, partial [Candidatus Methylomirabilales bacterium]